MPEEDNKQKESVKPWYKKWWFWVIVVLVLIIIGGNGEEPSQDVEVNNNREVQQQEKDKEEETEKLATIPGIAAVDVYGNLEDTGFSCSGPKENSYDLVRWKCKEETSEHNYLVEILGKSPSEIISVEATTLNYSNKSIDSVAEDFFGYVASVPYNNSDQDYAENWVKENIAKETDNVINGVKFTLVGDENSRILTIKSEDYNLDLYLQQQTAE